MNIERQADVAAQCAGFVTQTGRAIDWIGDARNAEKLAGQQPDHERRFRRSIRRATKLKTAAMSNMAVSVFGPSQNGKSFLVSVLARPHGQDLVTAFDDPGGALSYIGAINPPGEGESTGLVTRFTMTRPQTPPGFPVALTMMSVGDLAQTIANSFFMDGDQREPPLQARALSAHLETYTARAGTSPGAITPDGIWEIADYIERNFAGSAYARELRAFWDEAAALAPRLGLRDLGGFLAIIWGEHTEFTQMFITLAEGLAALGFSTQAFAPLAALVPRETSIIDVAQLRCIGVGAPDLLDLKLPDGATIRIDRAVLCALTAEFVLPMRDLPDEMFHQTDLLDFPGTRNRFSQPLARTFTDEDGGIGQLLLRGKVAYLFDRYVEDQKINAMLLCIKDSNMESIDLPKLIENWIALTQGATPEQRLQSECILFFLLTFFDKHLIDSAAGSGDTERFEKRLHQSVREKFGPSEWASNWSGGRKFRNTFWIRNPNFPVEGVFDYDKSRVPATETRLRPDKLDRMAELKAGHGKSPLVQAHFADPSAAWDAAMTLNDGGVGYLKQHLQPVCNIGRKLDQIEAQLRLLEQGVVDALSPMYVSDDLDQRIHEKQDAADRVIDDLEHALSHRSFAELLGALMVDQDQLFDRMSRVPTTIRISNAARAQVAESVGADPVSAGPSRPNRPSRPDVGAAARPLAAPPVASGNIRTMTRAAFQAEIAMRSWAEALDRLKDDPRLRPHFGLSPDAAASLAAELGHASRRCNLEQDIQRRFEKLGFGLTLDAQARPASVLAAEAINRFVSTLGMLHLPEAQRPRAGNDDGAPAVFAAREVVDDVTALPEQPRPTLEDSWQDWVFALYALYRGNAMHLAGGNLDPEMNGRLGEILRNLRNQGALK